MVNRFNLRGNTSLIIFQKYLKYIDLSVYSFFSELIYILIKKNRESFIERVENKEIIISESSRLYLIYENLKSQYVESILKEVPDFDKLSNDEIEKIMKKLSKSK